MIASLSDIEFLDTQVHKNMAIIPIKTPINYNLDMITLKKGFEMDLVNVKECEQSTVNTLVVENKSVTPLLLIDGEEIVGGDQNRIVNGTILIAPQSEMKIPVNCTEHGRWGYKKKFVHSDYIADFRTRSSKLRAAHAKSNVQAAVWNSIDNLEMSRNYHSPTQAMTESYENVKTDLSEFADAFNIEKGQTGVAVIIDGKIKGFEIFLNSDVYMQYHEKILKSYLINAEINDSVFEINADEMKSVMADTLDSEFEQTKSVGLEKRFDLKNDERIGTIYSYEDELIHCSFYLDLDELQNDHQMGDIPGRVVF